MRSYLLIDDDEIISIIHPAVIKRVDETAKIEMKSDGVEALEYIEMLRKEGHPAPDIIFLDINMPLMNGFEFLDKLSSENITFLKNSRIILLSSTIDPSDFERARACSLIDDFMTKPLNVEYIRTLVESVN